MKRFVFGLNIAFFIMAVTLIWSGESKNPLIDFVVGAFNALGIIMYIATSPNKPEFKEEE